MENQEVQDAGFDDFMSAFDDSGDYQTDADQAAQEGTEATDTDDSAGEVGNQSDSSSQEVQEQQPEKVAQEPGTPDLQQPAQEEIFTLKVNKEMRTCSREEMISLAQKGADYDRVKEQLRGQQEAMDVLSDLAKDAGTDIPGVLRTLRLNMLKKQGLSEDAAQERLLREAAERENAELKRDRDVARQPVEDRQQRIKREVAEFRDHYPKVELTDELVEKLAADVQKGKSLTEAYRSYETAQKDARIADLEQQLAAEKQNKANRAASPGSQKDSGGKRSKSDFDEFMEAFS